MNNTYNLSALDRIAEALEAMSGTSTYGNKYVVNFSFDETAEEWLML